MLQLESAGAGHVALARLERSDGELLSRLVYRLSPETVYRRFLSQGLATRMLASLAGLARSAGIERFTVTMQADNRPALRLLRRLRSSDRLAHSRGIYETTIPIGSEADL